MGQKINTRTQSTDTLSTSEQDTGKKWIDGRTIYRKTISSGYNAIAGTTTIPHGITGLTSSFQLLSYSGFTKIGSSNGTGNGGQSFAYREEGGNWHNFRGFDTTNISMTGSFAWGSSWLTMTVEYVK